jgi:hypothetical protein
MLRILGPNQLPVCWSNIVYNNGICKNDATFDPSVLSDNEKVLEYCLEALDSYESAIKEEPSRFSSIEYLNKIKTLRIHIKESLNSSERLE